MRQKYAELMFEKFQSPALLLAKDSVLSSFACGKTTALVVDIGAEVTTVAPIQEGWLETKGKQGTRHLPHTHLQGMRRCIAPRCAHSVRVACVVRLDAVEPGWSGDGQVPVGALRTQPGHHPTGRSGHEDVHPAAGHRATLAGA